MKLLGRLVPGTAVIVAAVLGYLYGVYGQVATEATPRLIVQAADPPEPTPAPSPSVSQLEQAAYTFAKGFEQLEAIEANVKTLISRMPLVPVWVVVVERAPKIAAASPRRQVPPSSQRIYGGLK